MTRSALAVALLLVALLPRLAAAEELLVFAAASTTDALVEAGAQFGKQTGHVVRFSFAGSNELARQIEAGAPADVFLSADLPRMDALEKSGRVLAADRVNLLSNELVVVVPAKSALALTAPPDLAKVKRLALADPAAVPAGVYAKQWLQKLGLWDGLADKVVPALDVRAALAAAASGRVDAAIVYRTDAAASSGVKIALQVPRADAPRIVYPVASLARSRHLEAARQLVAFLRGDAGRAIFEKRGFVVLP